MKKQRSGFGDDPRKPEPFCLNSRILRARPSIGARIAVVLALLSTAVELGGRSAGASTSAFDLVVYGGTPAGIITAVAAAREGLHVALLEPGNHLGGMMSGGLGRTDRGNQAVIGGYPLEFFRRVGKVYAEPITWDFEPHVAEKVFGDMLRESGVVVFLRHRLRENGGVLKHGTWLERLRFENGATFEARFFADATYEGDLMAQSGVSYTWGRESTVEFDESLAGVNKSENNFSVRVKARDERGRLLSGVSASPSEHYGAGDRRIQAYNFRLCLTSNSEQRVPFSRPLKYDRSQYELLAQMLCEMDKIKSHAVSSGRNPLKNIMDPSYRLNEPWSIVDVLRPEATKGGKTDTNVSGPFSTDYVGANYEYPNGDYWTRARIWREHKEYIQGLLYFLVTDPHVPLALRNDIAPWGLCKDEFVDNDFWPYQLYVREARRMRGDFVMSQKDITTDLIKPDSIGMGSFGADSHDVQRVEAPDGDVTNEGNMYVDVQPYQIPYRLILPKRTEANNLLVLVTFSATHVAYSSLRMEPQYMIIGHAAGLAIRQALHQGTALQDIDTSVLLAKLQAQHAVLEFGTAGTNR